MFLKYLWLLVNILTSMITFNAIMSLSVTYNKPIGNGIITALNSKQAYERCGIKNPKNKIKDLKLQKQFCLF